MIQYFFRFFFRNDFFMIKLLFINCKLFQTIFWHSLEKIKKKIVDNLLLGMWLFSRSITLPLFSIDLSLQSHNASFHSAFNEPIWPHPV